MSKPRYVFTSVSVGDDDRRPGVNDHGQLSPDRSAGFARALVNPLNEPIALPDFILKRVAYRYGRTANGFLIGRCLDVFRAHEAVRTVQTINSVNLHGPAPTVG